MNELIIHLLEEKKFDEEEEGAICIFLRKHEAHQLTPKGRLWELADGDLNLRFPGTEMDNIECEDGAFVLDWVVNDKDFAIALMDNGIEETGSILGMIMRYVILNLFAHMWLRSPATEQEDEQMCARAFAGMLTQTPVRLRDRPHQRHWEA